MPSRPSSSRPGSPRHAPAPLPRPISPKSHARAPERASSNISSRPSSQLLTMLRFKLHFCKIGFGPLRLRSHPIHFPRGRFLPPRNPPLSCGGHKYHATHSALRAERERPGPLGNARATISSRRALCMRIYLMLRCVCCFTSSESAIYTFVMRLGAKRMAAPRTAPPKSGAKRPPPLKLWREAPAQTWP